MKYQLLGRTGLRVSELCLGGMTFGNRRGWGAEADASKKLFTQYADAGGNFIDVANAYQDGESERLLGGFMGSQRDEFVVATKFSLSSRPHDPNAGGNHRKSMVQALEGSLRRLKTDYIDLYWMHAWDGVTPTDEVMRALDDMVRAGKILHIGLSDTPAWVVARSQTLAELRGWSTVAAIQINYNLVERSAERDLIPMARALGLTVNVWGGLAGGLLSGKYQHDIKTQGRLSAGQFAGRGQNARNFDIVNTASLIAEAHGVTTAQIALAWLRNRDPLIVPIIGARTVEQLQDNLGCLDVTLTPEDMDRLNAASAIDLGFPHAFLQSEAMQQLVFGNPAVRLQSAHS